MRKVDVRDRRVRLAEHLADLERHALELGLEERAVGVRQRREQEIAARCGENGAAIVSRRGAWHAFPVVDREHSGDGREGGAVDAGLECRCENAWPVGPFARCLLMIALGPLARSRAGELASEHAPEVRRDVDGEAPPAVAQTVRDVEPQHVEEGEEPRAERGVESLAKSSDSARRVDPDAVHVRRECRAGWRRTEAPERDRDEGNGQSPLDALRERHPADEGVEVVAGPAHRPAEVHELLRRHGRTRAGGGRDRLHDEPLRADRTLDVQDERAAHDARIVEGERRVAPLEAGRAELRPSADLGAEGTERRRTLGEEGERTTSIGQAGMVGS